MVQEGIKTGNGPETCRRYGMYGITRMLYATTAFGAWDENSQMRARKAHSRCCQWGLRPMHRERFSAEPSAV